MKILTHPPAAGSDATRVVILYGRGLIARPLHQYLRARGWGEILDQPAPWGDPVAMGALGEKAATRVREINSRTGPARLDIVWAAGVAGFNAAEKETGAELRDFLTALTLAEQMAGNFPTRMHLTSSAGGLFAGQRRVTAASKPEPRIPYGRLKLAQEEALLAATPELGRFIYRLTSVYGHISRTWRQGLVPTLIDHGIRHQVSPIFGAMETLRDYLWTDDVARHIGGRINMTGATGENTTEILGSGRPRTITEIITLIQDVIGHDLYVSFRPETGNRMDITFAPEAMPPAWHPTALEINIRRIHLAALGRG